MKRLTLLLLALALLPACGWTVPEPTTTAVITQAPTTTEMETITEAPTPTRATIMGRGVTYNLLGLNDKQNASIKEWLDGWLEEYNREEEYVQEILLDQTILNQLLEQQEETHEYLWPGGVYPRCMAFDDRFVFIEWINYKWLEHQEIYDKQEKRSIPFDTLPLNAMTPFAIVNDIIYMKNMNDDGPYYEEYFGELNLLAYDLKALQQGRPFIGIDLLASIPHEPALCVWMSELTKDGRYFIVSDVDSLCVFDLESKELSLQLSAALLGLTRNTQRFTYLWDQKNLQSHFAWHDGKWYWFPIEWLGNPGDLCHLVGNKIIEITLP